MACLLLQQLSLSLQTLSERLLNSVRGHDLCHALLNQLCHAALQLLVHHASLHIKTLPVCQASLSLGLTYLRLLRMSGVSACSTVVPILSLLIGLHRWLVSASTYTAGVGVALPALLCSQATFTHPMLLSLGCS